MFFLTGQFIFKIYGVLAAVQRKKNIFSNIAFIPWAIFNLYPDPELTGINLDKYFFERKPDFVVEIPVCLH